ncbi:hypothetical protein HDC92_004401 [Pedobacter sp. AK017]|uniref:hypothetical protein n=1 Tax=Pedobacter sp. AK017 TaxID=2723073 RepID=UPI001619604A|nr:hypothetical protein [Pedobacter sp. AK017]MBB5440698.1 hypothetical protein [Pedobacter sp. AK017]
MAVKLEELLNDRQNFRKLRISLQANIVIKNFGKDDEVCIIDNATDEILGVVGQDELYLISFFTGKITLGKMLEELNDYDKEDIKAFILQLAEQKIIHHSIS